MPRTLILPLDTHFERTLDDVVDLEINDWLTMDSWGNTPAIEEMIPIEFENL